MSTSEAIVSDPVIDFQDVSLQFRVYSEGRIATLKEWIIRRATNGSGHHRVIRALDGVSFSVTRGQAIGVIGRNGAGKSTLLRIAAGILQPSAGVSTVRGRIAPVIELGFGFEQELTGRELAFAIATTVDAQVLLLDEVLSVGDERFKRKCHQRMDEFRASGVTILFVSHDLGSVESLCDRALWVADGKIAAAGDTPTVVDAYRAWAESQAPSA